MDFEKAILAHRHWKEKLNQYLAKPDGSLSASEIAEDSRCELGKWIHGEGKKVAARFPEYEHLRAEHARFHQAAADVIRKADSGSSISGETALGGHSAFSVASTAVVRAIMNLRHAVEAQVVAHK